MLSCNQFQQWLHIYCRNLRARDDHLKIKKDTQIIYQENEVDYPFTVEYKRSRVTPWKLQMDKDGKNSETRDKDRGKQDLELCVWDLRMIGRKKKKNTKCVY